MFSPFAKAARQNKCTSAACQGFEAEIKLQTFYVQKVRGQGVNSLMFGKSNGRRKRF